ncbi:Carnosine N-methyltransferase [Aphelenchoides fujianensis]|nr:Carnosine N-methyltransferase [Aphelenchoides fujianensis]
MSAGTSKTPAGSEQDEQNVRDEIAAAEKVINALLFYERYASLYFKRQVKALKSCSIDDQRGLSSVFQPHIKEALRCAAANQEVLNRIVESGMHMFSENTSFQQAYEQVRASAGSSEHYMSKCRSTLKQIVREWSSEGAEERRSCYERVLSAIRSRWPDPLNRHDVKILVPGCGLGRLNWELLSDGFSVCGNEFSFFMILASNFLLNCCKQAEEHTIYPYILDTSNCWSFDDALRPNSLSPTSIHESEQFDCVLTVFFLDTGTNPVDYMRTIFRILKPGGTWISFGPLTYHFEGEDEASIELPFDAIVQVAEQVGFQMVRVEGRNVNPSEGSLFPCLLSTNSFQPSFYTRNAASMLSYTYHCGFIEATKP